MTSTLLASLGGCSAGVGGVGVGIGVDVGVLGAAGSWEALVAWLLQPPAKTTIRASAMIIYVTLFNMLIFDFHKYID